ncbi:MAG: SDR family NAD(P)-dependent oxidoreductase [Peptococcia bacterium]
MKKVAIVTGSAQGIGKAAVRRIAKDGMDVVIADLNYEKALEVAQEIIEEYHVKALAIKVDVADEESVKEMINEVVKAFGTVDVLVNNAAMGSKTKNFEDFSKADWDLIMNINFMSVVNCCKHIIPLFKAKRSGKIINVSSMAGFTGGELASPMYSAAKAAVISVTKTLAKQLGPHGVTANAIAPSTVITEMTEGFDYDVSAVALGRFAKPEDMGDVIAFLASDDSRYITGATIHVNGGTIML